MTAGTARGLDCPNDCGGTTRPNNTGRANDGAIYLRKRTCDNCGFIGYTFETWFEGATHSQMDDELKFYHRMVERKKKGYHGIKTNPGKPSIRFSSIHYKLVRPLDEKRTEVITDTVRNIYRRITSKNGDTRRTA